MAYLTAANCRLASYDYCKRCVGVYETGRPRWVWRRLDHNFHHTHHCTLHFAFAQCRVCQISEAREVEA